MAIPKDKIKVEVYLTPEEFEILKKLTAKTGDTYTEYMRQAFIWDAVSAGNPDAVKLTTKRMVELLKKKYEGYGLQRPGWDKI